MYQVQYVYQQLKNMYESCLTLHLHTNQILLVFCVCCVSDLVQREGRAKTGII